MSERGTKFNSGKVRMSLMPYVALKAIGMTFTFGELKYDTHNWRKGIPFSELIDASERHLGAFKDGENLDGESNLHHLAHAAFYMIVMLYFMSVGRKDLDDRYKKDTKAWGRKFSTEMNKPTYCLMEGQTNDAS